MSQEVGGIETSYLGGSDYRIPNLVRYVNTLTGEKAFFVVSDLHGEEVINHFVNYHKKLKLMPSYLLCRTKVNGTYPTEGHGFEELLRRSLERNRSGGLSSTIGAAMSLPPEPIFSAGFNIDSQYEFNALVSPIGYFGSTYVPQREDGKFFVKPYFGENMGKNKTRPPFDHEIEFLRGFTKS